MKAQHGHHVTPKKTLFIVFGSLVILTILTGLTAQIDLGSMNVPLAILIASSKATLVVLFFMALKYDNRVNSLVFALGVVFAVVFLTFTLFDTAFRGDLGNVGSETISDVERRESMMREREAAIQEGAAAGPEEPGTAGDTTAAVDTTAADTTEPTGADAAETDTDADDAGDAIDDDVE